MYWIVLGSALVWFQSSVFCKAYSSEHVYFGVGRGLPYKMSLMQAMPTDDKRISPFSNEVIAQRLLQRLSKQITQLAASDRTRRSKDIGLYRRDMNERPHFIIVQVTALLMYGDATPSKCRVNTAHYYETGADDGDDTTHSEMQKNLQTLCEWLDNNLYGSHRKSTI
ncbi:hypothetical protein Tcan_07934 [Toxocara canis]|uniref:Uncharacterized protein n=1 Tax=Toxocara canis TaxID=6265 RepID=A0A0B2VLT4_TOXCA|nr:hypothetical protein Tcan_07934 [Toxocara canis]